MHSRTSTRQTSIASSLTLDACQSSPPTHEKPSTRGCTGGSRSTYTLCRSGAVLGGPGSAHIDASGGFHVHLGPGPGGSASLWRHGTSRHLVDSAARRVPGIDDLPRLLGVGGIPGEPLHLRSLSLAVLFTGDLRRLAAQLVWTEAGRVARVAAVLAGAPHPADSRTVPLDVLLLPRRVLQGLLGRSAVVHRRRAALELLGREFVSRSSCRTVTATRSSSRSRSSSS